MNAFKEKAEYRAATQPGPYDSTKLKKTKEDKKISLSLPSKPVFVPQSPKNIKGEPRKKKLLASGFSTITKMMGRKVDKNKNSLKETKSGENIHDSLNTHNKIKQTINKSGDNYSVHLGHTLSHHEGMVPRTGIRGTQLVPEDSQRSFPSSNNINNINNNNNNSIQGNSMALNELEKFQKESDAYLEELKQERDKVEEEITTSLDNYTHLLQEIQDQWKLLPKRYRIKLEENRKDIEEKTQYILNENETKFNKIVNKETRKVVASIGELNSRIDTVTNQNQSPLEKRFDQLLTYFISGFTLLGSVLLYIVMFVKHLVTFEVKSEPMKTQRTSSKNKNKYLMRLNTQDEFSTSMDE
ncbi:hypothetical protein WA158_005548 [Blastocystis sp. Blastoise]